MQSALFERIRNLTKDVWTDGLTQNIEKLRFSEIGVPTAVQFNKSPNSQTNEEELIKKLVNNPNPHPSKLLIADFDSGP